MNRTRFAVVTLSVMLPLAVAAQSNVQTANMSTPMTGHEVQSLVKSAHSSAQYTQIAGYYHQQEAMYRAKAAEEKAERDRRAQVNAALMQKYPRPVSIFTSHICRMPTVPPCRPSTTINWPPARRLTTASSPPTATASRNSVAGLTQGARGIGPAISRAFLVFTSFLHILEFFIMAWQLT